MSVNNVESMNYAGTLFSKVKGEAVRQKINFSIFDTNKDGKFSISGVPQGFHTIRIQYPGYSFVEKENIFLHIYDAGYWHVQGFMV